MKAMGDEISNNWLGFSLSSRNMEGSSDNNSHTQPGSNDVPNGLPMNFSSGYSSYPGLYYGVEGENAGFHSPLTVMPLKSYGSLCLMEAINRSQPQVMVSSTPKLEEFFGGATINTHNYNSGEMVLSLDSMYYNHNPQSQTPNIQDFLCHNQENSRQHQIQVQEYTDYTPFRGQELYEGSENQLKDTRLSDGNLQLPTMGDNELSGIKIGLPEATQIAIY